MAQLKFLDSLNITLTGKLPAKDRFLPISVDDRELILDLLEDDGDYIYLALKDGRALEVIKAENYCGMLRITRGLEGTRTLSFRCGACLTGILTPTAVREYVCQNLEGLRECRNENI